MSTNESEVEQARTIAQEIGKRAAGDREYAQQLFDDPVGTLLAAGMPPIAVGDVLRESGVADDEVQGYVLQLSQRPGLAPGGSPTLGRIGSLSDCGVTTISGTCCITSITSFGGQSNLGGTSRPLP